MITLNSIDDVTMKPMEMMEVQESMLQMGKEIADIAKKLSKNGIEAKLPQRKSLVSACLTMQTLIVQGNRQMWKERMHATW